jgi:hypothetical protein
VREESIPSLAIALHIHPLKLCDYNRRELGGCSKPVPLGFNLRVPDDKCVPNEGVYECHVVKAHERLHDIAHGPQSVVRDLELLRKYNTDIMWNETLYEGMHLRLPTPQCVPDYITDPLRPLTCHIAVQNETVDSIARFYDVSASEISEINAAILGGRVDVFAGMQLQVPDPEALPPQNRSETNRYWAPYVVSQGDTLYRIGAGKGAGHGGSALHLDPFKICEANSLPDCDRISTGSVLTIPAQSCTPQAGSHTCVTIPEGDPTVAPENWPGYPLAFASDLSGSQVGGVSRENAGGYLGVKDWKANPFFVDFVTRLYQLNANQLATVQHPLDQTIQCKGPDDIYIPDSDLSNTSCHAYPGMIIAVPVIPCIPNDEQSCVTVTAGDFAGEPSWISNRMDFQVSYLLFHSSTSTIFIRILTDALSFLHLIYSSSISTLPIMPDAVSVLGAA